MPKLPRHKLAPLDASGAPDKSFLRAVLTKPPIAAYKIPEGREGPKLRNAVKEHWKAIKQQEEERFEALFALYDIPEDWDELTQWYTLARILAAERYQGLRTLMKAPGGPDGTRREKAYDLFREFEAYALAHPNLTHSAAAKHFVKTRRKKECAAVGFTDDRSFAQAAAKFSAKYPAEMMMPLSMQRRLGPPPNRLRKKNTQ